MTDVAVVNRESGIAPGGISTANHSAWLEQLESAQWQQRLRYQADDGQVQSRQQSQVQAQQQQSSRPPARGEPADGNRQPGVQGNQAFTERFPTHEARSPQVLGATAKSPVQQAGAAVEATVKPVWSGGHNNFMLQQQWRRQMNVQWQQQHLHVTTGTEGTNLWLRDARFEERDGIRLLREMRSQLARMGLRLAQFTLNGVVVSDPAAADMEQGRQGI